jgi:hypothetical protein
MTSRSNPSRSLATHNLPENAMEEVLALQSYLPGLGGVDTCPSGRSLIVQCPSSFSSGLVDGL